MRAIGKDILWKTLGRECELCSQHGSPPPFLSTPALILVYVI